MEVQNISGADMVSNRISVRTEISNENLKPAEEPVREQVRAPEENKGKLVDTYA